MSKEASWDFSLRMRKGESNGVICKNNVNLSCPFQGPAWHSADDCFGSIFRTMESCCSQRCRLKNVVAGIQLVLAALVIGIILSTRFGFSNVGTFFKGELLCRDYFVFRRELPGFDTGALDDRVGEVLEKLNALQTKLENKLQEIEKNSDGSANSSITEEYKRYLEQEVISPLDSTHVALRQIRLPRLENTTVKEDPLINSFVTEEIRKYITPMENNEPEVNPYGKEKIYDTIGHACTVNKEELEKYMDYEIGSYCRDDWNVAQNLIINGCDPLPRRRCLARTPMGYEKPYPINQSLWKLPDSRNVRWDNYQCRNFQCLASKNRKRGYSKCAGCFEMEKEKFKWVTNTSIPVDFLISDVLAIKPEEIRVGLDFSVGTGTFAARMREHHVTIISAAMNLGAPFSEMIALRGLVPLYISLNQRLPFFDNSMDLIHTTGILDGWIDPLLMDFILFDWDRVLRPGGILWIDRFFCNRKDQVRYIHLFLQLRYRKHKLSLYPKSNAEVYLSAVLEKPLRKVG